MEECLLICLTEPAKLIVDVARCIEAPQDSHHASLVLTLSVGHVSNKGPGSERQSKEIQLRSGSQKLEEEAQ